MTLRRALRDNLTSQARYQEALARIEQALHWCLEALDLSGLELSELPDSLAQLGSLTSLNLSGNELSELPEFLAALGSLKSLNLSGNKLREVPDALGQLVELQSLDLRRNQLRGLPDSFASLTRLESLYLSENQLRELPEPLVSLISLKSLDLMDNQLRALPDVFGVFISLQNLHLRGNELRELPESLASLPGLRILDLGSNKLRELPDFLSSLTSLYSLNLSGNELRDLPDLLGSFTSLKSLNLMNNQLGGLPNSLASLTNLQVLYLMDNQLEELPAFLGELTRLEFLHLMNNQLRTLPASLGELTRLQLLELTGNQLRRLPDSLGELIGLETLHLDRNELRELPEALGKLTRLKTLNLCDNELRELPDSLARLTSLQSLDLRENSLTPETQAAVDGGLDSLREYLLAQSERQIVLNEAKLILIGEGEVGKSSLLAALRNDEWVERRATTHGVEIKPVEVISPDEVIITLNGWDFGGQPVYRPTHQLFFSAPAVYLVVWKPREGPRQGFVKEWIKLVLHREPAAKMIVVASHGGPGERRPDIDQQELIDLFGSDTLLGFFHVDSKPAITKHGAITPGPGIDALTDAIAQVAAALPEVGRSVPATWQRVRVALLATGCSWMRFTRFKGFCIEHGMQDKQVSLFARISHTLGHLIHYHYDAILRDIVILKPDWLAKAISFVLEDSTTSERHGLISHAHMSDIWSNPKAPGETGYPAELHTPFRRLMQRFDLSYPVVLQTPTGATSDTSLIAQLVDNIRPAALPGWGQTADAGDKERQQICRIVDDKQQSATAEGIFYQLIVRLHRYSLGRDNYQESVHWQRGLMLEHEYNGRALLEHVGNDIRITVRAPYPDRFLAILTDEVTSLVTTFWEGLRCDVMVPCIKPCGNKRPGTGLYPVTYLMDSKKKQHAEYPCPICNTWQNIDALLTNASEPMTPELANHLTTRTILDEVRQIRVVQRLQSKSVKRRFDQLSRGQLSIVSQIDKQYDYLLQTMTDEAKDGPRLFSFEPVEPGFLDRPNWISTKVRLTLWCEHARRPLPSEGLNGPGDQRGVYELHLPRAWFTKAAPYLKTLSSTLGLVLPILSPVAKVMTEEATFKQYSAQLDLGVKTAQGVLASSEHAGAWLGRRDDAPGLEHANLIRAQGSSLRELHSFLKQEDGTFGGLERVQDRNGRFFWVHEQFVGEY